MKVCQNATDANHAKRPAVYPGPRCATCQRAFLKAQKARTKAKRIEKVYGLTDEQFQALKAAQGGVCAICWRPSRVRELAVDHDHELAKLHDHPIDQGCILCVRGLLCRTCNYDLLGHYGVAALLRAARYLVSPPSIEGLARWRNRL